MGQIIYSWASVVSTKKEFSALIDLVEKGSLEEFFITETVEEEVAGKTVGKGKVLVFSFSKSESVLSKLENIALSFSLDEVEDNYFDELEDEFTLKGVYYPESQAQEEAVINKLS